MCSSHAFGTLLNPIGAVAPKSGIGQALDPAAAIGRKVGGQAGAFIDPAGSFRDPEQYQNTLTIPQPTAAPTGAAARQGSSTVNGLSIPGA